MTDNEIIKAYGCCNLSHDECGGCDNCPCKIEGDCIVPSGFELEREVFNLLHRQKAEIERLKDYPKCVYEYDGDITDYCLKTPCPNYKTVDAIRAEAVKEFDELLKEDCLAYPLEKDDLTMLVDVKSYNNLVKEMVGADGD